MSVNENESNLRTLFSLYIEECEYIKRLRPATIKSYKEVFENFMNLNPEISASEDLLPELVNRFFKNLGMKEARVSTIRTYYDKLMAFFRWLECYRYVPNGKLSRNVIKPPQPRYDDSKLLEDNDIARIQSAIAIHSVHDRFRLKRDLLIVHLLLYTGIRRGELLGLRIQDIYWSEKLLHVRGTTSKSKKSRNIPLHPTLLRHLRLYIEELKKRNVSGEYLLRSCTTYKHFTQHGLKHWVHRYQRLSGVSFHLHRFRHTFACALAKANTDISSIKSVLGHSSIAMTERYLRSITSENSRSFIDTLSF